jgi:DNA mismatch repair ATPase MutS
MQNDKTTLKDLSVFSAENTTSIFALIDFTITQAGREVLRNHILKPPATIELLCKIQEVIMFLTRHTDKWPVDVSNGTIVMLEKFYEAADTVSSPPTGITRVLSAYLQKLFNRTDYFYSQFSLTHLADLFRGCIELTKLLEIDDIPSLLRNELEMIKNELEYRLVPEILKVDKKTSYADLSTLNFKARREMKNIVYRLIHHYAILDAWQSMAVATTKHKWIFPELLPPKPVCFQAQELYHPMLEQAVAYNIQLNENRNFLLLTGANMSGKTTFMRALGVSALLAHLGMGVPAKTMRISFLGGIITSMQVEDDLLKGESYFFAEVQRMKLTAQKLVQSEPHLVLMDELFKGTNVHDAYECTRAVVEGLLHRPDHLMILSTHLHEVAQHFINRKEIIFAHFVTQMGENGSYHFTYELKDGISNDRIGYRILQNEGVLELLKKGHL